MTGHEILGVSNSPRGPVVWELLEPQKTAAQFITSMSYSRGQFVLPKISEPSARPVWALLNNLAREEHAGDACTMKGVWANMEMPSCHDG
ncbi:hypothetical protein Tco_1541721 [Tanacetum coccineum]